MRSLAVGALRPVSTVQPAVIAWSIEPGTQIPAQRCVSLPFTAPALTAMRVRVPQDGGLEMLLSNPAGGRGIYVAGWATLRAFAAPSLHDILLADRVAHQASSAGLLSPASVRAAAVLVASEGHAGRKVAQVAQRALRAEQLGIRRLRAHLLLELARAMGVPGSESRLNDPWTTQPDDHGGWLAEAPHLLAGKLDRIGRLQRPGNSASWLPTELNQAIARIATAAWSLGIGPGAGRARLPRVLDLLSATTWPGDKQASTAPPGEEKSERGMVNLGSAIGARILQAEAALHRARLLLDDPIEMLAAWRADGGSLLHTLEQPDWLLDGWDRICLLPGDGAETSALAQMLLYGDERRIGIRSADADWAGTSGPGGAAMTVDRLARNEAMRLRELQLHDPDLGDA